MTYFVSVFDTEDPMAKPIRAASLFISTQPRIDDVELVTRDRPVMVAYGSTSEAALLALRSGLNSALGAVELEIVTRRKAVQAIKAAHTNNKGAIGLAYVAEADDDGGLTDIRVVDLSDPDEDDYEEDEDGEDGNEDDNDSGD